MEDQRKSAGGSWLGRHAVEEQSNGGWQQDIGRATHLLRLRQGPAELRTGNKAGADGGAVVVKAAVTLSEDWGSCVSSVLRSLLVCWIVGVRPSAALSHFSER